MSPVLIVALVVLAALVVYALTGGPDFGGGVWDLLASGPRARQQQQLIARAIAPIWEANHVWLILVVVLGFVCLPKAFAAITTALHVPLTLMLIGIVLRGSAFVFRAYDLPEDDQAAERSWRGWSQVFAISSVLTPIFLGVTLGAIVAGIPMGPEGVQTDFISDWARPFPLLLGLFVLALFAMLAAVYLANEAEDSLLIEDFRRRALGSAVAVGLLAAACLLAARSGAPRLWAELSQAWAFHLLTALAALLTLGALATHRLRLARLAAMAQVSLVVLGWGLAQYPYALPPDLSLEAAAAPESVLVPTLIALALGSVLLVPAFAWLFVVFKARRA